MIIVADNWGFAAINEASVGNKSSQQLPNLDIPEGEKGRCN